jgi:hypothetical protein
VPEEFRERRTDRDFHHSGLRDFFGHTAEYQLYAVKLQ